MSVLVLRHVPFEHLGLIEDALLAAGLHFQYVDLFASLGQAIPSDADGLIIMGGPMSANDEYPYMRRELHLITQFLAGGKPLLGACLGAQLLAKALGAPVYRNAVKEIGWMPVYFTAEARADPLFAGLKGPETVFHWHGETFDLPAGSVWLAFSDACRLQAFRHGSNAYGLQFHLEVTPAMISEWCAAEENSADVRQLPAPIDPHAHAARMRELSSLVFGRWAAVVRDK